MPSKLLQVLERFRNEYSVKRFGAVGDGVTDDTAAIQAAIDAAEASVSTAGGAVVSFPPGKYRVSETITVQEDAITLKGEGGGGDFFAEFGSALIPSEDFANDTYVLSFNSGAKTRTLYGNKLIGLNIFVEQDETLANTVHGLFWQCAKGLVSDVIIDNMSGRGCGVQGYNANWSTLYSKFFNCQFRRSGTDGCAMLGNCADMFFTNCVFGANGAAGLLNPSSAVLYTACHFTGNVNNVKFNTASTEALFQGCIFETAHEHSFDVDATNGGITRLRLIGCQFDNGPQTSNNLHDYISIHRDSGGSTVSAIIDDCAFACSNGSPNQPRYYINLAGAVAVDVKIGINDYDGTPGTAFINHNASAVRCLVNGLGRNVGDPVSTGAWNGNGEEGVRVVNTSTNVISVYANAAWRALN